MTTKDTVRRWPEILGNSATSSRVVSTPGGEARVSFPSCKPGQAGMENQRLPKQGRNYTFSTARTKGGRLSVWDYPPSPERQCYFLPFRDFSELKS